MTIPVGGIIRSVISFAAPNASVAQLVFWHQLFTDVAAESDVLDDMSSSFQANFLTNWALMASDLAEAFLFEVDEMNVDGTVKNDLGADEISVFGDVAGELLPAGVAGYLQVDSEQNKAKGKKYVPFMTETQVDDGVWNATTLARLASAMVNYLNPVGITGGGNMLPGVLSRPLVQFYLFTGSGYTTDTPAYQRRRKPNVGS